MDIAMKKGEENYHSKRVAFIIYQDEVQYLRNSAMSHKEWCDSLNISNEEFNNIVRGYYMGDNIVYYQGDFEYNENTIRVAKKTYKEIVKEFDLERFNIYCGVKKGKIGTVWELIEKIADEKGEVC